MKYLKKQKNKESGFTILETLISIFILLTAITGPLVYVTSGFKAARQAKYQMIAFFLVSETIEEIKFFRDNGNEPDWFNLGLPGGFNPATTNTNNNFDWDYFGGTDGEFRGCNGGTGTGNGHNCTVLYVEDATGRYGYTTGVGYSESIFTREVTEYIKGDSGSGNENEYRVTVKTSWDDGRISGDVEITEHIFDVHNN